MTSAAQYACDCVGYPCRTGSSAARVAPTVTVVASSTECVGAQHSVGQYKSGTSVVIDVTFVSLVTPGQKFMRSATSDLDQDGAEDAKDQPDQTSSDTKTVYCDTDTVIDGVDVTFLSVLPDCATASTFLSDVSGMYSIDSTSRASVGGLSTSGTILESLGHPQVTVFKSGTDIAGHEHIMVESTALSKDPTTGGGQCHEPLDFPKLLSSALPCEMVYARVKIGDMEVLSTRLSDRGSGCIAARNTGTHSKATCGPHVVVTSPSGGVMVHLATNSVAPHPDDPLSFAFLGDGIHTKCDHGSLTVDPHIRARRFDSQKSVQKHDTCHMGATTENHEDAANQAELACQVDIMQPCHPGGTPSQTGGEPGPYGHSYQLSVSRDIDHGVSHDHKIRKKKEMSAVVSDESTVPQDEASFNVYGLAHALLLNTSLVCVCKTTGVDALCTKITVSMHPEDGIDPFHAQEPGAVSDGTAEQLCTALGGTAGDIHTCSVVALESNTYHASMYPTYLDDSSDFDCGVEEGREAHKGGSTDHSDRSIKLVFDSCCQMGLERLGVTQCPLLAMADADVLVDVRMSNSGNPYDEVRSTPCVNNGELGVAMGGETLYSMGNSHSSKVNDKIAMTECKEGGD